MYCTPSYLLFARTATVVVHWLYVLCPYLLNVRSALVFIYSTCWHSLFLRIHFTCSYILLTHHFNMLSKIAYLSVNQLFPTDLMASHRL